MDRRAFLAGALATPFALTSTARRWGGHRLALVTADQEAHVAAVDLVRPRVVARVPTTAGPRSIETVGDSIAVVAHTERGVVSILDGRSLRVRAVVGAFGAPRYTAGGPGGRVAYVTDSKLGDVAVLDAIRGEIVERLPLGGPARHITLAPDGDELWVALGSKAEEVVCVSLRGRPRVVARLRPPFLAHDVKFAPDGRTAWVSSGDRDSVAIYDVGQRRARLRIAADAPPQHVAFIGARAYVTSGADGTLAVHDAADGGLIRRGPVPAGSYNVQQGGRLVATPSLDRGTLCLLDRDGSLEHELQVARSSHDACFVTGRSRSTSR